MRMRKVATGKIFRCKTCGENPVISTEIVMLTRWGSHTPVESYIATVKCHHGMNTGKHPNAIPQMTTNPPIAGIGKSTALHYAVNYWNQLYGKP